jgi:predicted DNA-binding transcriptional regulator AlpA
MTDVIVIDRIVREPERRHLTGVSRSQWWRLERTGKAPKRRQISDNMSGWLLSELQGWVASRAPRGAAEPPQAA